MGESEDQESDFLRVMGALFKEDIEDAVKSVYKTRVAPTIKRTAADSLKDIVDRLFGISSVQPTVPAGSIQNNQKTSYGSMYRPTGNTPTTSQTAPASLPPANNRPASSTDYNGLPNYVTLDTYENARDVVNIMNDKIREEGEASVNDLFDFAGKSKIISGNSAAPRYGWSNIDACSITQTENGQWMLTMPPYSYLSKKEN